VVEDNYVSEVLDELASGLQTPDLVRLRAQHNCHAVHACLAAEMELRQLTVSGSFGHDTEVLDFSDLDCLAEFPLHQGKDSSRCLTELAWVLEQGLPDVEVHIDSPAVVAQFGEGQGNTLDIIPARSVSSTHYDERGSQAFEIPNGRGGWRFTCTDLHKAYVADVDEYLGHRLKGLIRLVKAWKYFRGLDVSSVYLELRITQFLAKAFDIPPPVARRNRGVRLIRVSESRAVSDAPPSPEPLRYSLTLSYAMQQLYKVRLRSMRDPVGLIGTIDAVPDERARTRALQQLEDSLVVAGLALDAEQRGDLFSALNQWHHLLVGRPMSDAQVGELFVEEPAPHEAERIPQPTLRAPGIDLLVDELVTIGRERGFLYFDRLGESCKDPRVLEIGKRLDGKGGWRLMRLALESVRTALGDVSARELELAWDGIGRWDA
jgi:hypothetical protein